MSQPLCNARALHCHHILCALPADHDGIHGWQYTRNGHFIEGSVHLRTVPADQCGALVTGSSERFDTLCPLPVNHTGPHVPARHCSNVLCALPPEHAGPHAPLLRLIVVGSTWAHIRLSENRVVQSAADGYVCVHEVDFSYTEDDFRELHRWVADPVTEDQPMPMTDDELWARTLERLHERTRAEAMAHVPSTSYRIPDELMARAPVLDESMSHSTIGRPVPPLAPDLLPVFPLRGQYVSRRVYSPPTIRDIPADDPFGKMLLAFEPTATEDD